MEEFSEFQRNSQIIQKPNLESELAEKKVQLEILGVVWLVSIWILMKVRS